MSPLSNFLLIVCYSPVASGSPSAMFIFCTAAAEAPFPRLSKIEIMQVFSSFPLTKSSSLALFASSAAYIVGGSLLKGRT